MRSYSGGAASIAMVFHFHGQQMKARFSLLTYQHGLPELVVKLLLLLSILLGQLDCVAESSKEISMRFLRAKETYSVIINVHTLYLRLSNRLSEQLLNFRIVNILNPICAFKQGILCNGGFA